jgi:hypothetical protein
MSLAWRGRSTNYLVTSGIGFLFPAESNGGIIPGSGRSQYSTEARWLIRSLPRAARWGERPVRAAHGAVVAVKEGPMAALQRHRRARLSRVMTCCFGLEDGGNVASYACLTLRAFWLVLGRLTYSQQG